MVKLSYLLETIFQLLGPRKLKIKKLNFPGYVEWLNDGIHEFPHFILSADTDTATQGMLALSSTNGKELFLCYQTADEYRADIADGELTAKRINLVLGRSDIRVVKFIRSEKENSSDMGSFGLYCPSIVIYQSIFDSTLEAKVVKQQEPEEFIKQGGSIRWVNEVKAKQ